MAFRLERRGAGQYEFEIEDEPSYVHALPMSLPLLEPRLNSGLWLVVYFPVWSGPERSSVLAAIRAVKGHDGRIQLGVRPFDNYEEIFAWWPTGKDGAVAALKEFPSIGWVALHDGKVLYEGAGLKTEAEVDELIGQLLPVAGKSTSFLPS
jgi:hypothetical protein